MPIAAAVVIPARAVFARLGIGLARLKKAAPVLAKKQAKRRAERFAQNYASKVMKAKVQEETMRKQEEEYKKKKNLAPLLTGQIFIGVEEKSNEIIAVIRGLSKQALTSVIDAEFGFGPPVELFGGFRSAYAETKSDFSSDSREFFEETRNIRKRG